MTDNDRYDPSKAEEVIARLSDNVDLVDIAISVEDYLDSNDMYGFKNWIKGELVGGPYVRKYWIKVTFKWNYEDMPDPSAAARLLKHGTRITYRRAIEEYPIEVKSPDDYQPGTKKPRMAKRKVWLVDLVVPRRFVRGISSEVLDLYSEDLDMDTTEDAIAKSETPDQSVAGAA